jgi:hypothetical protein
MSDKTITIRVRIPYKNHVPISVVDAVNANVKHSKDKCFTLYLNAMELREDSFVSLKETSSDHM